jgi:glycosyltransferase involved in cell wall biosynthesis
MRILLLSAYDAHSHRRWREGLVSAFPDRDWSVLTLPPRHFNWRIRGNSLSWAFAERECLDQPRDLLIATSMTDLATLKGLVPGLAAVPTLVYCHENQFAYPTGREATTRLEPRMVNLYSVLAADRVVFNSAYNRDSLLAGVQALLDRMPDAVPPGITGRIRAHSCILPVPLEAHWFSGQPPGDGTDAPLTIVWNHRWEYDKAPERLFHALLQLRSAGVEFRVHVVGQQFREVPPVFAEMQRALEGYIGAWGTIRGTADYRALLRQSHVVLSTALHEFQGLAVLEAVASGCIPLVPDRLAFPELFGPEYRYPSSPAEPERESGEIAWRLALLAEQYDRGALPPAPDVSGLSWSHLRPAYAAELDSLARDQYP